MTPFRSFGMVRLGTKQNGQLINIEFDYINTMKVLFIILLLLCGQSIQAQNIGVKTVSPQTVVDVNGSVAVREGTPLTVSNGTNNNIVIDTMSFYRISAPTSAFTITGFTNGFDGRVLTLINTTSYTMTLKHQSTLSTATNRINTGGSDLVIAASGFVTLLYNNTLTKWIVTSSQGAMFTLPSIATGALTDSLVTINSGVLGKSSPQTYIGNYAWKLLGNSETTAGTNFIGTTDAQSLVFETNNTEGMRMLTSGNVGINTTTPQYKLDINANTGGTGNPMRLQGLQTGTTSDSILSSNGGILRRLSIAQILSMGNMWSLIGNSGTTAGTHFIGTTDAVDLVFKTNNAEGMRITSAGNIGIGTSEPNTSLDVNGGLATRPSGVVSISTGNTTVTVGNSSFIVISSNHFNPNARKIDITNGLQDGQQLLILIVENSTQISDGVNCQLASTFDMTEGSTLSLVWYSPYWYEVSRSLN
jgi:hypothetical protein